MLVLPNLCTVAACQYRIISIIYSYIHICGCFNSGNWFWTKIFVPPSIPLCHSFICWSQVVLRMILHWGRIQWYILKSNILNLRRDCFFTSWEQAWEISLLTHHCYFSLLFLYWNFLLSGTQWCAFKSCFFLFDETTRNISKRKSMIAKQRKQKGP